MKIFEFLSAVSTIALISSLVLTLVMMLPTVLILLIKENEKSIFITNAINRILVTSVVSLFVLKFTNGYSILNSIGYYIIGFYFFMVLFTLFDESKKRFSQENAKKSTDILFLKSYSFNIYLIIIALIYYVLAIIFPILTDFSLPSLLLRLYYWLIGIKIILWATYVLGVFNILYTIKYTFSLCINISNLLKNI